MWCNFFYWYKYFKISFPLYFNCKVPWNFRNYDRTVDCFHVNVRDQTCAAYPMRREISTSNHHWILISQTSFVYRMGADGRTTTGRTRLIFKFTYFEINSLECLECTVDWYFHLFGSQTCRWMTSIQPCQTCKTIRAKLWRPHALFDN